MCLHDRMQSDSICHMASNRARAVRKDSESEGARRMDDQKDNLIFPVAYAQSASPLKEQTI